MKKPWIVAVVTVAALVLVSGVTVGVMRANATTPDVTLYFETETFALTKEHKDYLDTFEDQFAAAKTITIHGFVQRSKEEDKNKGPRNLSQKRADAVEKYIQQMLKQRSKKKQTAEYVSIGMGQPPRRLHVS